MPDIPQSAHEALNWLRDLEAALPVVVDASSILADVRWRARNDGQDSSLSLSLRSSRVRLVTVPSVIAEIEGKLVSAKFGEPERVLRMWRCDYRPWMVCINVPETGHGDERVDSLANRDPDDLPLARLISAISPVFVLAEDKDLCENELAGTCSYCRFGEALVNQVAYGGMMVGGSLAVVLAWEWSKSVGSLVSSLPPLAQAAFLGGCLLGAEVALERKGELQPKLRTAIGNFFCAVSNVYMAAEQGGRTMKEGWVERRLTERESERNLREYVWGLSGGQPS